MDFISKYNYKKNCVIKYANIPCGFDIETTSTYIDGEKIAFMYYWNFGMNDKIIAHGRDWNSFIDFCISLVCDYDLNENKRLIVYVHNLAFEFQFMRKYFNWIDVFSADNRKPIYAVTDIGIEFRDSYILSAMSLELTAKNLLKHDIKKLVGNLDYSKIRNDKTIITKEEKAYIDNDVLIILAYISEQIEQYGDITKIPLTNTGRVRQYMKRKCLQKDKSKKKSVMTSKRYRELMKELILTMDDYYLLKRCFQGGFTHASIFYSGKILSDVSSIDFTSSYPFVMLSEKYPMGKPEIMENISYEDILKDNKHGYIFDCSITGLHSKLTYESYLSEYKSRNVKNAIINNGRIMQADYLETSITNIDLKIVCGIYDFTEIKIYNVRRFYMSYLPTSILNGILELYGNKTKLKGVEGKEQEYLISKQMLNSIYGMCVTDIIRDLIIYDNDDWNVEKGDYETQLIKHNESKNRFLYYPWGVFVTAYARYNLFTGIINIGDDYVYSDTDSIKFLNYEKHIDYINEYNDLCIEKLKAMCDYAHIDFNLCKPKTIEGKEKLIGIWDYEGTYKKFKTLGAKRYIYTDDKNKLHITIAGLSKKQGAEYIEKQKNPYEFFNDDMYINSDNTGKNTHTYIDIEKNFDIIDYTGKTSHIKALSGVHLEKCDFTLSLAIQYKNLLKNRLNGIKQIRTELI